MPKKQLKHKNTTFSFERLSLYAIKTAWNSFAISELLQI